MAYSTTATQRKNRLHRWLIIVTMARADTALLQAALVGCQVWLATVNAAIADILKRRGKVSQSHVPDNILAKRKRPNHRMSAEGSARIAEAQ